MDNSVWARIERKYQKRLDRIDGDYRNEIENLVRELEDEIIAEYSK